jgi:DNA-binding NtrC family response regulator
MNSVKGKSILVVDDDPAMLRALSKILSGEGATIREAGCAEDALKHLVQGQERFDLVITDLRMPNSGGKAVLEGVKAALPKVPVIIITAFGSPELRNQCLIQGAAAFVEKPVDSAALLASINHALSRPAHIKQLAADRPVRWHRPTVP